jgi:hypothetical protein
LFEATPWEQLKAEFRWKQGEHLAAIAPTGAGKTTLFSELMPYRKHNIMFGTKPADSTYDRILKQGYQRIESISEVRSYHSKYLLWPHQRKSIKDTLIAQRDAFMEAMDVIVGQGAWTVWVDESKYIAEMLKLRTELTYCLEQLRSIDATIICGAQRPAFLPLSVLSNSSHIFMWKTTLDADAKRLADIGGVDAKEVMSIAKTLDRHEFLYIRTRGTDAKIIRSQVERK